jgi:cbb3-type cytochrome oxidase subunit 3
VFLTFLLNRNNPYRLKLSVIVLITISLSELHYSLGNDQLYASGFFLLMVTYFLFSREKRSTMIYLFICSFIVSISYVSFHLFEIYDPIWIIINKQWMIGIFLGYLAILLQKTLKGRLFIIISGTMQGEILYAYILSKYHFPYSIGGFDYLDVFSLISVLLVGWSCFENAGTLFQNHFNFIEKEKQKSS